MKPFSFPENAYILTTMVNIDQRAIFHEEKESLKNTILSDMSIGQMFKWLMREYGKCVGKMYIDSKTQPNNPIHIGWVFHKRMKYSDCKETYLAETWISFNIHKPEKLEPIKIS